MKLQSRAASTEMLTVPPTRWISRSTAVPVSSLACSESFMSPISSSRIVPPAARSKVPMRRLVAPVNAPCSWPNQLALDQRISGTAAQLTTRYGPLLRALLKCRDFATSSFPGAALAADQYVRCCSRMARFGERIYIASIRGSFPHQPGERIGGLELAAQTRHPPPSSAPPRSSWTRPGRRRVRRSRPVESWERSSWTVILERWTQALLRRRLGARATRPHSRLAPAREPFGVLQVRLPRKCPATHAHPPSMGLHPPHARLRWRQSASWYQRLAKIRCSRSYMAIFVTGGVEYRFQLPPPLRQLVLDVPLLHQGQGDLLDLFACEGLPHVQQLSAATPCR